MPPKGKGKPRAPKGGHQLAEKFPAGEILRDCIKQNWKLGKPIGSGGFGLIYLADRDGSGAVTDNAPYVMKVEPHSNGPLFCELHFYQRVAKPDLLQEWSKQKKLKFLGVPKYMASGSHERGGTKYRFMVMERCGDDLQKVFEANGKRFSERAVYALGIRMLNALEYIHDKEYVHADIKASNMLTGYSRGTTDQVYLVDYGLAFRYTADGRHKEYREDPKRVHDGTVEFTSRDAHRGVAPSRRGDLEILGYCMLQWLSGELPWEDKLANKDYVRDQKIKYMNNVNSLLTKCLPKGANHDELGKFLRYSADLKYEERPDYDKCRQLFTQALKRHGGKEADKLVLGAGSSQGGRAQSPAKPAKGGRGQSPAKPAKGSRKRRAEGDDLPQSKYLASPQSTTTEDSDSDFQVESPTAGLRRTATPRQRATPASSRARRPPSADKRARTGTPKTATPRSTTPRSATPKGGARRTATGEVIPVPAVPPTALVNGNGPSRAKAGGLVKTARKKALMSSAATQTSPGLKGLKRSRKK